MFPGQRVSRRTQNIEAMSMSVDAGDDGFDDYGVPTKARARGSAPAAKQKGFFGRMRRGSASNLSAAGVGDGMDSDDDDDGAYANVPGFQVLNGPQDASRGSMGPYSGALGPAGAQTTPQGLDSMRSQPPLRSSVPSLNGAPLPPQQPQGEISMDQISSLRDRHRYPAIDDDPQKGRAMSLNSMSTYDTTPIIPTLGGPSAFAAVGPHSKASQQDKYRQRMIESRRALMSSETGIPLTGNVKLPDPIGNGMPAAGGAPRSMSMTSVHSQFGPGRGAPGDRSNTMNSQTIPPPLMHSPLMVPPGGGGPPQQYMRAPHPGPPHSGPPHPAMRQGLGVQMGQYGGLPQGNMPHGVHGAMRPGPGPGGPMPMQRGPSYPQGPQQAMYSPSQGPYASAPVQQQPGYQPQYLHSNQDGSAMAPPLATPQLDGSGTMRNSISPMRNDMSHLQFPRGSQPPQIGLQKEANESNEFDFGPVAGASLRDGRRSSVADSQSQVNTEELDEQINSLKEDVRVLTIELVESVRREHDLPPKDDNSDEKDGQMSSRARAEALAKAQTALALERAKRQAAEKAASGNPTVEAEEKLAEIEYRHAETLHLLSTRTEQYEALKKRFASLEQDFAQRKEETEELVVKAKNSKLSENLYEQDEQLRQQINVLETENKKLREELDNYNMRGPLGSRITALEDQRSALQEALRAMRERKDAEINALNHRIEMLNAAQQRVASSSSSLMKSVGARAVSGSSMLASKDPSPSPGPLMTSGMSAPGPEDSQLSLPRMRHSSLSRPASPLRLGLEYSH